MKKVQTKILAFGSILAVLVLSASLFLVMGIGVFAKHATPANPSTSGSGGTIKNAKPINYQFSSGITAADIDGANTLEGAAIAAGSAHNYVTALHWKSTFTFNGTTFRYTMIGTAPTAGNVTSVIPVNIIPVELTFASDGSIFNGNDILKQTVQSPIFKNAQFTSGNTQFGDAIQRAEFFKVESPNYHVLLSKPQVLPTLSLTVPVAKGVTGKLQGATVTIGLVDVNWYDNELRSQLIPRHISTKSLTIFLVHNVFKSPDITTGSCCIGGYHNAVKINHHLFTYAESTYNDPGAFPAGAFQTFSEDINALSHETAEWYNDPFVNNLVPPWSVASLGIACQNNLEVGDPLVGDSFLVNGYHPQNEAFFSWFARQSPSIGQGGRYDYLGHFTTFSTPGTGC